MPELRSCYFCGDPGESLGTYAVIPPRLNPTEEEQRTVVLCSTCQKKLVRVMEPLVDRVTASPASSGREPESGAEPAAGGSPPASTEAATADESTDQPGIQASDRSVTFPSGDADGSDGDADAVEPAAGPDTSGADVGSDGAAASTPATANTDDGAAERETAAADQGTETVDLEEKRGGELPDEYRTVMRLVENREFPMARADLETVVTSAYGIDDDQCRRILDAAIERGVLVEDGAELDRP
jgi:hypothetical protein